MIKSVTATNYLGESLTMGIGDLDKSGLLISSIDGIGPGESEINITELAATDGAVYNSSRIPSRNIVLNIIFNETPSIEDTRHLTYKMFPLKKPINLSFLTDNRSLQIDGYVESNDPSIFDKQEGTSISIICPGYFFYALNESSIVFGGVEPLFEFPFWNDSLSGFGAETVLYSIDDSEDDPILDSDYSEINGEIYLETEKQRAYTVDDSEDDPILDSSGLEIYGITTFETDKHLIFGEIRDKYEHVVYYEGDAETGMVITLHFLGPASNITLYNLISGTSMKINTSKISSIVGSSIKAMDDLVISTMTGKKRVTFWRNGKSYNVLNCLDRNSDWLKLDVGRNILAYVADTGHRDIQIHIQYYPLYEGV